MSIKIGGLDEISMSKVVLKVKELSVFSDNLLEEFCFRNQYIRIKLQECF